MTSGRNDAIIVAAKCGLGHAGLIQGRVGLALVTPGCIPTRAPVPPDDYPHDYLPRRGS